MKSHPKRTNIEDLARKWAEGTISGEERERFEKWYASFNDEEIRIEGSQYESKEQLRQAILDKVRTAMAADHHRETRLPVSARWAWTAAAAIAILLIVGGIQLFHQQSGKSNIVVQNDIKPGGNNAILTLADGKKIILGEAIDGKLAEQGGISITKAEDGRLVYEKSAQALLQEAEQEGYNQIETPRGGHYQVELPDGSRVWLNAASSLRYPARFEKAERVVELTGEAYFEVETDASRPFLIKAGGQEVRVLGTRFNLNAYSEEQVVKTTLLEGAVNVKISSSSPNEMQEIHLKPGEQSLLQGGMLSKRAADIEAAVDWKNDLFIFNNEPLEHIMRKISRWYNVDIVYRDEQAGQEMFWGSVSRFSNVSVVLQMLEETGDVGFHLKGNTIEVQMKEN